MKGLRGRDIFDRVAPLLSAIISVLRMLPRPVLRWLLRSVRGLKGSMGLGFRYCLVAALDVTDQPNVSVREDVYLLNVHGLRLGRNVSIHPMCYIDAAGGIRLGSDISVAHGTTIMSTSHNFDVDDRPINDQGVTGSTTVVEDNCWIGAQCVVLAGVRIGAGSVVGANSVVTKDVPPLSVVAGSPAKVVGHRRGLDHHG